MSRYIDADALITAMNTWDWQELYLPIHFKQLIDEQPTADLVEVKHGEWIWSEHKQRVCSNCQCPVGFVPKDNGWHEANYCPNCGADMKGGTDNGNSI